MANPAVESLKYNYVIIESLDGQTKLDITNSIVSCDYFEDILSPCVTMSMILMNSASLVNFLPIRGGERLGISVNVYSGEFERDEEFAMYVYKASEITPGDTSEFFTLHLVSREALTNETSRCMRRFSGNIKNTVEDILKTELLTEKFNVDNIEQTGNSYEFLGNTRKPFTVLTWLGPKGVPTEAGGVSGGQNSGEAKGVAGFLFWENSDGFNFKSVETLVSNTSLGSADLKDIPTYNYTGAISSSSDNSLSILSYKIEKNVDLLKSLRVGTYSNYTYFMDFYTGSMNYYKYTLKDEIKSKLGTEDKIAVSEELGDSASRIMVRISDRGVLDNSGVVAESGRDVADMAKSVSRYNILFSQSLNMTVPCNINLKAGDVIKAEFPALELSNEKEADSKQSGNYLIKELRHHFEGQKNVTSLKLVRDSYGLYGSNNN